MDSKPQHLYYDKKPVSDVSASLQCYPAKEFQSPTRSTVPLLSLLKDGRKTLMSLLVKLQMNADSDLYLEFTVDPPKGKGRPSQTDLMVKWHTDTLAVEAKWTEPRYETVDEWAKQGNTPENHKEVLRGWLDLLQPYSTQVLHTDDFPDAVYQMVHRAASACYKSERPRLAYLHFTPDPSGTGAISAQYRSGLEHLYKLLGNPPGFPFYLVEMEIKPTEAFEQIKNLPKASENTARTVIAALPREPLFNFDNYHVHKIEGTPLR